MKTLFGTFKRFINGKKVERTLVFDDLVDEFGEKMNGVAHIDNQMIIATMKLKFGNRYMITYSEMKNNVLLGVSQTVKVNKHVKCKFFRRYKDEIHFVGGKYQGKKDSDLTNTELSYYCIWLGRNTNSEATIKNCLQILKKIHGE